jgi:hypothetical protein
MDREVLPKIFNVSLFTTSKKVKLIRRAFCPEFRFIIDRDYASRFSEWLKNTDTGINQYQLQVRTYDANGSFSVTKQYYSFKSEPYAINQINNIKPSKKTIIIPLL